MCQHKPLLIYCPKFPGDFAKCFFRERNKELSLFSDLVKKEDFRNSPFGSIRQACRVLL